MDNDIKEIIKSKYKKLPITIKKMVGSEHWSDPVYKIGHQFNLSEDQIISLKNEVFLVLICLEPAADFWENIQRELSIDNNLARRLSDFMNGSVFGPVMKDIRGVWEKETPNPPPTTMGEPAPENKPEMKSGVGDSFEEAILMQARAMRPVSDKAPDNLPTENKSLHDYPQGNDPYREPAE